MQPGLRLGAIYRFRGQNRRGDVGQICKLPRVRKGQIKRNQAWGDYWEKGRWKESWEMLGKGAMLERGAHRGKQSHLLPAHATGPQRCLDPLRKKHFVLSGNRGDGGREVGNTLIVTTALSATEGPPKNVQKIPASTSESYKVHHLPPSLGTLI